MKTFDNGYPCCGGTVSHAPGCKGDDNRYLTSLVCRECDEPIDRSLRVLETDEGEYICEYCLDEMDWRELVYHLGIRARTAGEVAP